MKHRLPNKFEPLGVMAWSLVLAMAFGCGAKDPQSHADNTEGPKADQTQASAPSAPTPPMKAAKQTSDPSPMPASTKKTGEDAPSADPSAVRTLYEAKCAQCHGKDGKGNAALAKTLKVAPPLLDMTRSESRAKTDAEIIGVIQDGKAKMPKYRGKLTDAQIKYLAVYLRTLPGS